MLIACCQICWVEVLHAHSTGRGQQVTSCLHSLNCAICIFSLWWLYLYFFSLIKHNFECNGSSEFSIFNKSLKLRVVLRTFQTEQQTYKYVIWGMSFPRHYFAHGNNIEKYHYMMVLSVCPGVARTIIPVIILYCTVMTQKIIQKILNHNANFRISLLGGIYEKQINLIKLQRFSLGKPHPLLDLITGQYNSMTTHTFYHSLATTIISGFFFIEISKNIS